jgi:hypothetical protein
MIAHLAGWAPLHREKAKAIDAEANRMRAETQVASRKVRDAANAYARAKRREAEAEVAHPQRREAHRRQAPQAIPQAIPEPRPGRRACRTTPARLRELGTEMRDLAKGTEEIVGPSDHVKAGARPRCESARSGCVPPADS